MTNTSDEILHCATAFIVASGYNGFSYSDVSGVVGIRKASIHHHFPSKVDLVRTLLERYRQDAEASLAQLVLEGLADQLRAYTDYWATCTGDGTRPFCVCALLASEIQVMPPETAAEIRAYFRLFSSWLPL